MDEIKAVQMIGTQRSGSNLLRVMLDTLDGVFAPHPPHILQRFLPLVPLYGSFGVKPNRDQFVNDVCQLVKINPVPWDGVVLDEDEINSQCKNFSLYELFQVIYDTAAKQTGASHWICKSMQNVHYAKEMEAAGIFPYYIYLYRDGRDVALSFKKAIVGEKHIYSIAKCWQKDQAASLQLRARVSSDRFISIRYEDLIVDAENELKRLCGLLGVSYTARALEYYKSKESAQTSTAGKMWENVTQPILKNNKNKFLSELSSEEICIFESVASNELTALGYDLVTPREQLRTFTLNEINEFEEQNKKLKANFLLDADSEDIRKRQPQEELLQKIKENYKFTK